MSKRLQIPVSVSDQRLFKSAAKAQGLSAAEWARRILRQVAEQSRGRVVAPSEALQQIFSLNAPVNDVKTMIAESIKGRFE